MIYLEPDLKAARIAEEVRVERIKKQQAKFLVFFSPISFLILVVWFISACFKVIPEKVLIDLMAFALCPIFAIGMAIDLWFDYEQQSTKNVKKLAWEQNGKVFIVTVFPLLLFKDFPWVKPIVLTFLTTFVIVKVCRFARLCTEGYRILRKHSQRKKQKRGLP